MEDDDIEYDITFPSPNGIEDETAEDYVIEGEVKEPVVILLGWAGCKERHLEKYCSIYEERCITIRYIPPTEITFFKPHYLTNIASKVLELIGDYNLEENPVFFHVFSNNGCYVYSEISKILTSSEGNKYKNIQVQGVIIDSAPGKRRVTRAAWAFANASGKPGVIKYFIFLGMIVYLVFMRFYLYTMSILRGVSGGPNPNRVYQDIKDDKSRWPQLFIYSDNDQVIPPSDVKEVITYRRDQLHVDVESTHYVDSEHVAHFRLDPNGYTLRCKQFIRKCTGFPLSASRGEDAFRDDYASLHSRNDQSE
ncbi:hypothetical protein FSP39_016212 [Pinctada imbricata]|uniref:Transmembrane protein 53 n=1 Tax=Pinctada imbricata TaxID=66713 RepID=A0AA88XSE1_PINIB|nr:hypothetical protein FSP39_016212 [Pinctada imbricata]